MTRGAFLTRALRLAVVALVGSLGVFVFADGLHSVHHLPDQDAASRCALAAASAKVVGATVDLVPFALPPLPRLASREECAPAAPVRQPIWVAQGRAPPLARS
jgi:hypothetical protein